MSFRVRPATGEDFAAIYEMAKLTGGGFTNLPPDRATLVAEARRDRDDSFRARGRRAVGRPLRLRSRRPEGRASSAARARCSGRSAFASPSIPII